MSEDRYSFFVSLLSEIHYGQMYGGEPYINHILRVAGHFTPLSDEWLAAMFHDSVEDGKYNYPAIAGDAGHDVMIAVSMLTKQAGQSLVEYYERIIHNPIAFAVKKADLIENIVECHLRIAEGDKRRDWQAVAGRYSILYKYLTDPAKRRMMSWSQGGNFLYYLNDRESPLRA